MAKKEKRKHLGRGLESLLGPAIGSIESDAIPVKSINTPKKIEFPIDIEVRNAIQHVPMDQIEPNPYQPRMTWNDAELNDLCESIKANGLIQPILLRKTETGFQVIAGERRLRASKLAGLEKINALVRDASDEEMLELALVENIHRANLNPIERALAYQRYQETFDLNQTETAKRLGEDRSVVANYLRLLGLPKDVKEMLVSNELSMGHARAILALPTPDLQRKLAARAMTGRLSVREVEKLVRRSLEGGSTEPKPAKVRPANIIDLENKLRSVLGTKVQINARKNSKRGKIIIEYYSLDEFDRLTAKMGLEQGDSI
jgi:ParB family chromosome partitioning protein